MNSNNQAPLPTLFSKSELVYTSCYCEENIYKLVEKIANEKSDVKLSDLFVVFISNQSRAVPIWYQNKCESDDVPVMWDYHVIAVYKDNVSSKSYVYDLDTTLGFPETFEVYLDKALVELPNIKNKYKRNYKVISAEYYLKNFASDRSHMIDKTTGSYLAEPPSYPCIKSDNSENNIQEFITMKLESSGQIGELATEHGTVFSHSKFVSSFK